MIKIRGTNQDDEDSLIEHYSATIKLSVNMDTTSVLSIKPILPITRHHSCLVRCLSIVGTHVVSCQSQCKIETFWKGRYLLVIICKWLEWVVPRDVCWQPIDITPLSPSSSSLTLLLGGDTAAGRISDLMNNFRTKKLLVLTENEIHQIILWLPVMSQEWQINHTILLIPSPSPSLPPGAETFGCPFSWHSTNWDWCWQLGFNTRQTRDVPTNEHKSLITPSKWHFDTAACCHVQFLLIQNVLFPLPIPSKQCDSRPDKMILSLTPPYA